MSRDFNLSDILTITTGRLVSSRHMEGVHDLLNFMTQDTLFTHQLPRAAVECRSWLLRQHPILGEAESAIPRLETMLAEAAYPGAISAACDRWVDGLAEKFGRVLPVDPIPRDDHEVIDPIAEAIALVGEDRVIVVSPEGD
jgi:hypothetical protein